MHNKANSANYGTSAMQFDSFAGGCDGEYNGAGVVEISKLLAMQDDLFHETMPSVKVY